MATVPGGERATGDASCLAPRASMRFEPDGSVQACCVNSRFPLGNVEMHSIREIWEGVRADELARALEADDFSLGCAECGGPIEAGSRSSAYARTFDQYGPTLSPRWPRRLEFAISNRCNLMCVQCNGELSSAIRSQREHRPPLANRYGEAFFAELDEFLDHAEHLVFLGGEPFLMPEVRRIWDRILEIPAARRPTVDVTTNGTIWNDRVERYVRELRMNVAVSIDGATAETGEAIRVGSSHATVLQHARRFSELSHGYGGAFGINVCLLPTNHHELLDLLRLGDELDGEVHVIPLLYPRDHSILLLPRDELRAVVASLEAQGPRADAELGRNRPAWDRTLAQLRAHADQVIEIAVDAPARRTGSEYTIPSELAAVHERLAAVRAELEAAGRPVLVIEGIDGVVASTEAPPWAEALDPGSWQGRPMDELAALLAGSLGGDPVVDVRPEGEALLRADIGIAGAPRLRALVGEWVEDGRPRVRAYVTELA